MKMDDSEDAKILKEVADTKKSPGDPTKHDPSRPGVYMMPESFNALRRELEQNFPALFRRVGGFMAFDAQRFIQEMDSALDLVTQFDSGNVDGICRRYLDKLRAIRGLKPLHNSAEYFHNQQMEDSVKAARQANEEAPWKRKQ